MVKVYFQLNSIEFGNQVKEFLVESVEEAKEQVNRMAETARLCSTFDSFYYRITYRDEQTKKIMRYSNGTGVNVRQR